MLCLLAPAEQSHRTGRSFVGWLGRVGVPPVAFGSEFFSRKRPSKKDLIVDQADPSRAGGAKSMLARQVDRVVREPERDRIEREISVGNLLREDDVIVAVLAEAALRSGLGVPLVSRPGTPPRPLGHRAAGSERSRRAASHPWDRAHADRCRSPATGAILSWRTMATAHREERDDALASIHRCQAWQRPWRVKAA
jgi:hypothetical protein